MKQETFYVLDYDEFDSLIKANFPKRRDFEFLAAEECANDTDHAYMRMGIPCQWKDGTDPAWIAKQNQDEVDDFEKWANGEKVICFGVPQIINGLIRKSVLQPGNYLIRVSW